jgi:hypothetical protein
MTDTAPGAPNAYMERTRLYYRALGYENDYVWANLDETAFARLDNPLSKATIALLTTAGPPDGSNRNSQGKRIVWSGDVATPPADFNTDLAWDKESTNTDDRETFLPIDTAQRLAAEGLFAKLAPRFHGVPTDYSLRKTMEHDAPELLYRLREDGADAALLTAL